MTCPPLSGSGWSAGSTGEQWPARAPRRDRHRSRRARCRPRRGEGPGLPGQLPTAGSLVLLDAGSTTSRFAAALPGDLSLVVVTHAVPIAARIAPRSNLDVHLLADLRADVAFFGTNGLTLEHGLSTPDTDEAAVKRAMVRSSRRVVVLADSFKIGVESSVRFAAIDQVDVLVTDEGIATADRRAFEDVGIEVVVA